MFTTTSRLNIYQLAQYSPEHNFVVLAALPYHLVDLEELITGITIDNAVVSCLFYLWYLCKLIFGAASERPEDLCEPKPRRRASSPRYPTAKLGEDDGYTG